MMRAQLWSVALFSVLACSVVVPQAQESLLRRSDVGAFVPGAFRARLAISQGAETPSEVEIWRSGADRTLLRFLAEKERGKFLLRRGAELWLIAPTAKEPVRLSPSHRVYGAATMDVLFALRLADDYRIDSVEIATSPDGPLTIFELRALADTAQYAEVRYAVRTETALPVNALYRLRSGRATTRVVFTRWNSDRRYARSVEVTDLLRKGAATRIEVLEFDERTVPEPLFDLRDGSARRDLERTGR